jgi:hypothetical protein
VPPPIRVAFARFRMEGSEIATTDTRRTDLGSDLRALDFADTGRLHHPLLYLMVKLDKAHVVATRPDACLVGIIYAGWTAILILTFTSVDPFPPFMADYAGGSSATFDHFVVQSFSSQTYTMPSRRSVLRNSTAALGSRGDTTSHGPAIWDLQRDLFNRPPTEE